MDSGTQQTYEVLGTCDECKEPGTAHQEQPRCAHTKHYWNQVHRDQHMATPWSDPSLAKMLSRIRQGLDSEEDYRLLQERVLSG